jgi:hypothetical protein
MSRAGARGDGHLGQTTSAFWGDAPTTLLLQRAAKDGGWAGRSSHGAVWPARAMLERGEDGMLRRGRRSRSAMGRTVHGAGAEARSGSGGRTDGHRRGRAAVVREQATGTVYSGCYPRCDRLVDGERAGAAVVRGPVGAAGGVDCVTMLSASVFAVALAVAVAVAVSVVPRHVLLLEGTMLLLGHVALFAIAVAFEATCRGVERLCVHWRGGGDGLDGAAEEMESDQHHTGRAAEAGEVWESWC